MAEAEGVGIFTGLKTRKFRTPDIAPKSFQCTRFSPRGANLKLSAFCSCNDRIMIWDSMKSEREAGRSFLVLISRNLQVAGRSEEHTSELQSLRHLVCRLLLEKQKIALFITLS